MAVDPVHRQYGDILVEGSGVTVVGDVGTLIVPRTEPDEVAKFGLCLGSALQIDSAQFIGRTAEIEEIRRLFQLGRELARQQRVALGGMGGMGKTQLAIAYATRYQQMYDSIFWLNATSSLTLHADLRLVMGRLLPVYEIERLNDEQVLARFLEWLSRSGNTRWLLIFDNYDEPDEFDIAKYCPYAAHGSVILTTRLPDYVHLSSERIRLQPLNNIEDSLEILQKRSRRQDVRTSKSFAYHLNMRISRTNQNS